MILPENSQITPHPNRNSPMRAIAGFIFIAGLTLSTCALANTVKTPKKPKIWSGSAAFGYSSVTGTYPSLSLNSKDWIRWQYQRWENRARLSYNYTAASTAVYANRLVLQNQSRYYFKPKVHYVFGDIRYDRNPFDGYYYHLAEIIGEGNIIHLNKTMSLDYQVGVGAQEDQPIGLKYQTNPAARLAVEYEWHLTRHATFKEDVTALLSTANNNTYESVTSVQTRLYGPLSLQLSYTATYNELPVISYYKKLNTITTADLMYKF